MIPLLEAMLGTRNPNQMIPGQLFANGGGGHAGFGPDHVAHIAVVRLHESEAWQPLVLAVEATELANDRAEETRLGHPPAGVVFAAELFAAAQTVGDVDLQLHIEDDSGNSVEHVLSPAFSVTPNARRRAVKP